LQILASDGDAPGVTDDPAGVRDASPTPRTSVARALRTAAELAAAASAGGLAWYGTDLLEWSRWPGRVEGSNPIGTMILMGGAGILLGAISRLPGWIVGTVTAALPIVRIPIDWIADPTSHNLFPFEVAIYLFVSSPAVVAAVLLDLLRGRGPFGTVRREVPPPISPETPSGSRTTPP